jgi:Uma2 family endonuclease
MSEPAHTLAFPEKDDGQSWPSQGRWTYEDYRRLPDDGRRYEVIRGFLYVAPAPNYDHQFATWQLSRLLGNFVVENDLGVILLAPFDIQLPKGIATPVQPDLAFVRKENQPRAGAGGFEGVPDLVVEILSPGTRRFDHKVKLPAFRDAGVPEVWMTDPMQRTVRVLSLGADRQEYVEHGVFGPGETVTSTVLPGLRLEVDRIFPPLGVTR